MGLARFGFFRPIRIGDTAYRFSVGVAAKTIDQGMYGGLPWLLREVASQFTSGSASITSDGRVQLTINDGPSVIVTWTDTDLRDILGFTGATTTFSSHLTARTATAPLRPLYSWTSTYGTSDAGDWQSEDGAEWHGVICQDGRPSGVATGPTHYRRSIKVVAEHSNYILDSRITSSTDADRTLEKFVRDHRLAQVLTASEPSPRGCYLWHDMSNFADLASYSDRHGLHTEIATPDLFQFVTISDLSPATYTTSRLSTRLDVDMRLNTATPPTWTAPA